MRRSRIRTRIIHSAGALLIAAASGTTAWGQASDGQTTPNQPGQQQQRQQQGQAQRPGQSGQQQQQQAPEGFIIIEERVVWLLGQEPQEHFLRAVEQLGENQPKNAAAEVRIAANYLDIQASRDKGSTQELKQQSQKLRDLANQLAQGGQQVQAEELVRAFAKANLALAKHHQSLADSSLQKNQHVRAGHDLETAAILLRQGLVWSKQQPQPETVQVIANAQAVATELMGEDLNPGEPGQQARQGQAQVAAGRQGGESPVTGTSKAEATNIDQHAQQVTQALAKQIQQLSSKIGQGQQGQQGQSGQSGQSDSGSTNR